MADPNSKRVVMCAYQVKIPVKLRRKAIDKAIKNGTNMSLFVRMAIEKFANDPIEKSMEALRKHKSKYE